jgi:hypothetical protein
MISVSSNSEKDALLKSLNLENNIIKKKEIKIRKKEEEL